MISFELKQRSPLFHFRQTHLLGLICLATVWTLSACQPSATLNPNTSTFLTQPVIAKLTKAEAQKERVALEDKIAQFLADPQAPDLSFGNNHAALAQFTSQEVNQLRKTARQVTLTGRLELSPDTAVSGIPLTVYAPDGSTLGVAQTNREGQYTLQGVPAGMRIELVASTETGRSLASALLDLPATPPSDSIEQNLTLETTAVAEAVWLASRDGRSGLEQISVAQIEKYLRQNPEHFLRLVSGLSLLNLVSEVQDEIQAGVQTKLNDFQTQSVFKRSQACSQRSGQMQTGFKVQQIDLINGGSPKQIKLLTQLNGLSGVGPEMIQSIESLNNNINSPNLLISPLSIIQTSLNKNTQISTLYTAMDLREAGTTELKSDLTGIIGRVGNRNCSTSTPPLPIAMATPLPPLANITLDKTTAAVGDTVTLKTTDFSKNLAENKVMFGDVLAKNIGMSFELDDKGKQIISLQVEVPMLSSVNPLDIKLMVNQQSSNAVQFTPLAGIMGETNSTYTKRGGTITLNGLFGKNHKIILTNHLQTQAFQKELIPEFVSDRELKLTLPNEYIGLYKLYLDNLKTKHRFLFVEPTIEILSKQVQNGTTLELAINLSDKNFVVNHLVTDKKEIVKVNVIRRSISKERTLLTIDNFPKQLLGEQTLELFLSDLGYANTYVHNVPLFITPQISRILPENATEFQKVEIQGVFDPRKDQNIVKFGDKIAVVESVKEIASKFNFVNIPSPYCARCTNQVGAREVALTVIVPQGIEGKTLITVTNHNIISEAKPITLGATTKEITLNKIQNAAGQNITQVRQGERLKISTSALNSDQVKLKIGGQDVEVTKVTLNPQETLIEAGAPKLIGNQEVKVEFGNLVSNGVKLDFLVPTISNIESKPTHIEIGNYANLPPFDSPYVSFYAQIDNQNGVNFYRTCQEDAQAKKIICPYQDYINPTKYSTKFVVANKTNPEKDPAKFELPNPFTFELSLNTDSPIFTSQENEYGENRVRIKGQALGNTSVKVGSAEKVTPMVISASEIDVKVPMGLYGTHPVQLEYSGTVINTSVEIASILDKVIDNKQISFDTLFTLKTYHVSESIKDNQIFISPYEPGKNGPKGEKLVINLEISSVAKSLSLYKYNGLVEMSAKLIKDSVSEKLPKRPTKLYLWVKTKDGAISKPRTVTLR